MDTFVERVESRLNELRARRAVVLAGLTDLQGELQQIEKEGQSLYDLLQSYASFMDLEPDSLKAGKENGTKPRTAHLDLPRGAYADLTYAALMELGGAASLGQIVRHLRQTGRIPEADHSYYSTRSALNRQPDRIVKIPGGFRLKEMPQPAESHVA
jgi:hypothetical protein